ncbi:MAG: ATPase domain-containing protein [archaeon]
MERLKTGIIGLDEKTEGGFVKGSIILVVGKTGTGKTQFCSSFIYAGAIEKESGLYITTEERVEDIKEDINSMFNWDFTELEQKGLVKFLSIKAIYPERPLGEETQRITKSYLISIRSQIAEAIKEVKAQRVVLDSVSILEMFMQDRYMARVMLFGLVEYFKALQVTVVVSGEIPETSQGLTGSGIIEYLVDGVIKLDFVPVSEEFKRTLTIRKMRRTDHSTLIHPFEITPNGLHLVKI